MNKTLFTWLILPLGTMGYAEAAQPRKVTSTPLPAVFNNASNTAAGQFSKNGEIFLVGNRVCQIKSINSVVTWELPSSIVGTRTGYEPTALSPDGKSVTYTIGDHLSSHRPSVVIPYSVRVCDSKTGRLRCILVKNSKYIQRVEALAWSPDSKYVALGRYDGVAQIFEARTGKLLAALNVGGAIGTLKFSPLKSQIAVVGGKTKNSSNYNRIQIWNYRTRKQLAQLDYLEEPKYTNLTFSPNGKVLVVTPVDSGRVIICDAETLNLRTTLSLRGISSVQNAGSGVSFSPDGRIIAFKDKNRVCLIDSQRGQLWGHLSFKNQSPVSSVHFLPDGRFRWITSDFASTRVWETDFKNVLGKPAAPKSGGRTRLATARKPSAKTPKIVSRLLPPIAKDEFAQKNGHFSANGQIFMISSYSHVLRKGAFHVYQMKNINSATRWKLAGIGGHYLAPNGKFVAVISGAPTTRAGMGFPYSVEVRDAKTSKVNRLLIRAGTLNCSIYSVAWSPDSKLLATCSGDGQTRTWDIKTGRRLATVPSSIETRPIGWQAFSPSGHRLAVWSSKKRNQSKIVDYKLAIWDYKQKKKVASLGFSVESMLATTVFSPDGKTLTVVNTATGQITIHDAKTLKIRGKMTLWGQRLGMYDPNTSSSVSFSPDSKRIAFTDTQRICLVNAQSGRLLGQYTMPRAQNREKAVAVSFLPNGRLRWITIAQQEGITPNCPAEPKVWETIK